MLGTSQDMQIMHNSTSTQIEEILAQTAISSPSPLPLTDMGESMLNRNSFAQFSPSLWRLLTLA
jgi:hypothetical protein